MNVEVTFTPIAIFDQKYNPKPSSSYIPEWYKKMDSYKDNNKNLKLENSRTTATIKKCIPVYDSITAGYIIELQQDVYVEVKNNNTFFKWSSSNTAVVFHENWQASDHPEAKKVDFPKFLNYWGIKTPKNYSCLFVQPFHRESPFTIFPGVVDTDRFCGPVNFPFMMNDKDWEGIIPAGTPIAQVIPFRRDFYKIKFGGKKEGLEIEKNMLPLYSRFYNTYKDLFWAKKEYK